MAPEMPLEIGKVCMICPHMKKKGGLNCPVSIKECHSRKVREWRKQLKEKQVE